MNRGIMRLVLAIMGNIDIRQLTIAAALVFVLGMSGLAAGNGPQVQIIDGKMSIWAEAVPLSWFFKTFDKATGMSSTVPPALGNRNISVQFSNLSFDEAVHKIFEGQKLDYILVGGTGIVVMGTAQTTASSDQAPAFVPPAPENNANFANDVFVPPQPPIPQQGNPSEQPATIQTPFGPIPNPRANQGNPTSPLATPGQQSPFGTQSPFGQPNSFGQGNLAPAFTLPNAVTPGVQPGSPFGSVLPGQTQPRE